MRQNIPLNNTFRKLKLFLKNPFVEWRRLFARFENRTKIPTHYLSPTRFYIKCKEERLLPKLPQKELLKMGNYFIKKDMPFNSSSIIYSAGIGTNISFDLAMNKKFNTPIHMIDPTPNSWTFFQEQSLSSAFIFHPVALYKYNGSIRFYPDHKTDNIEISPSFSVQNRSKTNNVLTVQCITLATLMENNKHSHIDLLKMDIEGAARHVLEEALANNILPNQIICELEIPAPPIDAIKEMKAIEKLLRSLKQKGYNNYRITQSILGARIELLSVKKDLDHAA